MQNLQSSNLYFVLMVVLLSIRLVLFLLKCKHGDVVENRLFYVVDNLLPPLLGLKTCLCMGLLKILYFYSDVFIGIGCLAQPYTVLTDHNVTPV